MKSALKTKSLRGFSLLEIVIAMAIASICIGLVLKIESNSLITVGEAADYATAVQVAEAQLALLMSNDNLKSVNQAGVSMGRFQWEAMVRQVKPTKFEIKQVLGVSGMPRIGLVFIRLVVSWEAGNKIKNITLESYKLINIQDPEADA